MCLSRRYSPPWIDFTLCSPILPVKATIAYRFGDMYRQDSITAVEAGNGAGYYEYTVLGSGREVEPLHGTL